MSLIAHYKLDGNANDALGKYNGTASNVTWVDGKLGKAGSFNGSTSYIETQLSTAAHNLLSVSFWIFNQNLGSNGIIGTTVYSGRTFNLYRWPNMDDFHWSTGGASGVDYAVLLFDQWTHVVLVSDGSTIKRYYNGTLKGTSAGSIAKNTSLVHIGRNDSGYSAAYIDDIRFYDHALSEREVRDLSQGLVLHYTFDQFQEPTENKASGITYSSYAPYHNISGDANKVTMVCAKTNIYMTIAGFGTLQGKTITVSGYMKKNGASYLPPLDKTSTYETATAVKHVMDSSTGRFEVTQVYDSTSDWLFHTPITAVAGDVITIEDFQVEFNKGYATPFVNGTRAGIVRDQSTQGNDAPLALSNTPKWVEGGMVGKGCYEFAGNDKTPGILSPQIKTDTYTISFWAKHTSTDKMAFGSGRNTAFYWYGDNSWKYTHGGISGEFYYPRSQTINIGEWGHFVVTYDGSNVRIYRNGIYEGIKASSGIPNFDRHSIGWGFSDQSYDFQGQMDDVRIYTTALSAEEVKELYQQRASLDSGGNLLC